MKNIKRYLEYKDSFKARNHLFLKTYYPVENLDQIIEDAFDLTYNGSYKQILLRTGLSFDHTPYVLDFDYDSFELPRFTKLFITLVRTLCAVEAGHFKVAQRAFDINNYVTK